MSPILVTARPGEVSASSSFDALLLPSAIRLAASAPSASSGAAASPSETSAGAATPNRWPAPESSGFVSA
jgi:hypothetical protein